MLCPSCLSIDTGFADASAHCASCGAQLFLDGQFRLDGFLGGERSHDSVDGVGPLLTGVEAASGQAVLVRLATADDKASRLEHEAVITAGLTHGQVPRLLKRLPGATVWAAPKGVTIDTALQNGLRTDGAGLRRFLTSLLTVLADLEAKSPPVHLCGLHAGNVVVDDDLNVTLVDFSRATDTLQDASEATAARPGMTPPKDTRQKGNCAVDLYGAVILTLQIAARTAPEALPRLGTGQLNVHWMKGVDLRLAEFLSKIVRGGFKTKAEALRASGPDLAPFPIPVRVIVAFPLVGLGIFALLTTAVVLLDRSDPPPPPLPDLLRVVTVPDDASVDVDGVSHPVHVIVTSAGRHRVTAHKDGFVDASVDVDVNGPTDVTLQLTPLAKDPPKTDPPKTDPPKTDPPKTEPPKTDPPKTDPPPPSIDDALLRAIEAAVRAQKDEIEACPDDGTDRIKLHLLLKSGRGTLTPLARGDTDSVRCVVDSVAVSVWPQTPHQQVDVDIWIWRKPAFKVAAY